MARVTENKLNETNWSKSPLDYIEEKLQENDIDYTVEQAMDDRPYDTWITINDGQDSLADEIICSVVGYAYDWVRDKYGNRKYCKVATDEDTINELNESLKGNHSFKGLTKKVVEAKETCSQDYLRYKKQLQNAKSIDELRKVWQTIKKDLDDDMSFEEDKKLSDLFLDRKKELKESLKEATGKIQKVSIKKQGNTKDRYKVLVTATNGKKSEKYLSEDDIKPFVNGLKKKYGDFEIEDPSNTLNDNTDLFKETFNDLVEETKRLMQEEDYDIHDAIYEAVNGLFLDKQIKAIKDYYRSLGNKYIEDGDEWYDCLADDIIDDIKYGEGLDEKLKKEWKPFGGRVADINSSVGKFDYDFFDKIADDLAKGKTRGLISTPNKKYNTGWELTINDCKKSDFKCKEFYNYLVSVIVDWVRHKKAYQFRIDVNIPPEIYSSFNRKNFKHDLEQMLQYDEHEYEMVFTDLDDGDEFLGHYYYDIFISYDLNINLEYYEKIVNREKNDGKDENLKESWIQFTFEDGSNPYVAKTKEEQDRMFKKYKGRVEQVSDITYLVKSEKKKVNEADDRYFSTKPSNDIKIKKFVREYADEIKDDIDNDMYDEYGMWSKYLDMFIMDFPKNKLTTSEFAIKFFDEINKRFGSNFHYGYTREGLNEYIEPFYDGSHAHDWFYKFLKDNDIKVKKATKFGEYDEYSGVAGGHTFKTYSYKPTNVITGPEGFLSGIEIDGVKIPHYVKGNNGSRELWNERHFSVKDVFDLCNNNLDIDKINKIVSWKDEWNKLLEPLMVDYDESLQEDKDITTDWFVKNDIDNVYYNHKGDRLFETDQELNGRWVFVPKDKPSKRMVFKTLDDAMKYGSRKLGEAYIDGDPKVLEIIRSDKEYGKNAHVKGHTPDFSSIPNGTKIVFEGTNRWHPEVKDVFTKVGDDKWEMTHCYEGGQWTTSIPNHVFVNKVRDLDNGCYESLKEDKNNAFKWAMDEIKYARSIYDLYKLDDTISNYSNDLTPEEVSKLRHEISCRKSEMWTNQGRGR